MTSKEVLLQDPVTGQVALFREVLKKEADFLGIIPLKVIGLDGKRVEVFDKKQPQTYRLAHPDPKKGYLSEQLFQKDQLTSADFEVFKCAMLRKHGFPENLLWLTECQSLEDFAAFYGKSEAWEYNLQNHRSVLYWHESGSIQGIVGFTTFEEFERGCQCLAKNLKTNLTRHHL